MRNNEVAHLSKTPALLKGERIWESQNQHELKAKLTRALRRGEIAQVAPIEVTPWGAASVKVRMIDSPRRRVTRLAVVLVAFATIVGVAVLAWMSRYFILAGFVAMLGVFAYRIGKAGSVIEVIQTQIVRIKR